MLIIGSHVSFGKEQLLGSTKEAISYGANTFMFYTGAPTNTARKDIEEKYTKEAKELMELNNIDIANVVCHAPYIVNLANKSDETKYEFSIDFIRRELARCDSLGISKMVLHPGSAVGITKEEGLNNIIEAINKVLDGSTKAILLFETMAGKGSECGTTIEEMAYLIEHVEKKDQIGICLDTCHLSDGGYSMEDFSSYLKKLQEKVDLSFIKCIHINDSKNPVGAHKDRHENIGFGYIGFDAIRDIVYNEQLANIPKILETPYIGDTDEDKNRLYPPYKVEIEMLRKKEFNPNCKNEIRALYKK